jgi:hypothetical protein
MEERKERVDEVLKWAIWIYGFLCIVSIFTEVFRQDDGLWNVVAGLTFLDCGYMRADFCQPIFFEGMNFLLLIIIVAVRYIMFGKTYQK